MATASHSILYDWVPESPRIAILAGVPQKNELVNREAFGSDMSAWFLREVIGKAGLTKNDVIFSHLLRCRSDIHKGRGRGDPYPTGPDRIHAEKACEHFDHVVLVDKLRGLTDILPHRSLSGFDPNVFLATFDMSACRETYAMAAIAAEAFKRAVWLAGQGYRPLVGLGNSVFEYMAPHLKGKGGVKALSGHYWFGHWVRPQPLAPELWRDRRVRKTLKALPLPKVKKVVKEAGGLFDGLDTKEGIAVS